MTDTTLTFTPEAVRAALLAAGFTEYTKEPYTEGFQVGDIREARGEIVVTYHSGGREWASLESMWEFIALRDGAHRDALAAAGYRVTIEDRYVVIREG